MNFIFKINKKMKQFSQNQYISKNTPDFSEQLFCSLGLDLLQHTAWINVFCYNTPVFIVDYYGI